MIMFRTTRCALSMPLSMGWTLAAASFSRVEPKVTGRPGYAPADLLKLYIYGYLNRVRSSRRLEAETHRNIEVIWLLRHLKPDFKWRNIIACGTPKPTRILTLLRCSGGATKDFRPLRTRLAPVPFS
jgi:hypothetical protein